MKNKYLTAALIFSLPTMAMAVNCDRNPTHPSCGVEPPPDLTLRVEALEATDQNLIPRVEALEEAIGNPQPQAKISLVLADAAGQYIGTPFDNGLMLFRGFDGYDGAYELLFNFSNGIVSASGPTYFTDQDCGLSGGGAYVSGMSNGSKIARGTGFGTGDDIYLAASEGASPPDTTYSSYIESPGAACRNGSGTRTLIPAVKASLTITYPVRYEMR